MDDLRPRDFTNLAEAIRGLSADVKELRAEFASTYARKDITDQRFEAVEAKVDSHSSWLNWANRVVLGSILLALVAIAAQAIAQGGIPT